MLNESVENRGVGAIEKFSFLKDVDHQYYYIAQMNSIRRQTYCFLTELNFHIFQPPSEIPFWNIDSLKAKGRMMADRGGGSQSQHLSLSLP